MPHAKPVLITLAALLIGVGAACSIFNATSSGCIAAAEDAGLPDSVIEQLRNRDGLSAVERAALRRVLVQADIDGVCDITAEDAATSSRSSDVRIDDSSREQDTGRNTDRVSRDPAPSRRGTRIPLDDENLRRCRFWALNNLQPVVYSEFAKLNPETMDDLDRILWRSQLHRNARLGYYDDNFADSQHGAELFPREPGIYCRDFWAEPLNRSNAELRNQGFEPLCRSKLQERIKNRYSRLADAASYQDNALVYDTPNQYMRVLEWLDLSGGDLINSDQPPYRILEEQSQHPYAYLDDWIPSEDGFDDYTREADETLHLEWLGIVAAAGLSDRSDDLLECHYYYPQLFYGYWVPFDPDQMPDTSQLEELELPRYEGSTTPIYLPRSVTAEKIRAGYPLGKTAERYHLCRDSSETEDVSYYYVDHPTGDYCERKPKEPKKP